jgi:hypothetical protein
MSLHLSFRAIAGLFAAFVLVSVSVLSPNAAGAQSSGQAMVMVDAAANRHPISPYIYGVALGDESALKALNSPDNRIGGDSYSTYNWKVNTYNNGQDWFYESSPSSFWPQAEVSMKPGERVDSIIAWGNAAGATTLVTVPINGWVAKVVDPNKSLWSFSVAKYGPQQKTDSPGRPDAGNGVRPDGALIVNNDPNDAEMPESIDMMRGWIEHLKSKWGTAAQGGVKFYILDNEPAIWQETHRDTHPLGAESKELLYDIIGYANMIKSEDPDAQIVAPEEFGWEGYFDSGADKQYRAAHGWPADSPDRTARGGMDNLPWLLMKLHEHDVQFGKRLLDYFTVHYYPSGADGGSDASPDVQLLRNRSTRSLWDPNYVDEGWIKKPVELIPRMKQWVARYYPGTKIGITEYNFGAENSIGGATAEADALGIFGREGLDLATRWMTPDPSSPTFNSMRMYRNYDGKDSAFGDESVSDTVADPDNLSSFAAVRHSDGAMTVMVINKNLNASPIVSVSISHFAAGRNAQVWQLTSANKIARLPDLFVSSGLIQTTVPAQSVTLFVVPHD